MNEAKLLETYELETLSWANLSWANLFDANLADCDLYGTDLSRANLSKANLSGANLSESTLFRANLSSANLLGANLAGAHLVESNLSGANLSGVNLSRANLSESNLSNANLLGVQGLASMKEEMEMLVLLREQIRQESFEFDMSHWHAWDEEIADVDRFSFESFLETCGTSHCGAGFCQVKLAEEGNPIALTSAPVAGSHAIPSMAWLFTSPKERFIEHLDKLISGEKPLLQR